MSVKKLIVQPLATRSKYLNGENVDFLLDHQGMRMVPFSVRISGTLVMSKAVDTLAIDPILTTDNIYYDGMTGVHGAFSAFSCSFSDMVQENLHSYPRLKKMKQVASKSDEDAVSDASQACELVYYDDHMTKTVLNGPVDAGKVSFSFKPDVCINNADSLPYSKTGQVKISLRVADNSEFFYGSGVTANTSFWLEDLLVDYQVMTESKGQGKVKMLVKHMIKQQIESTNSNISMVVPLAHSKISSSMVEASKLTTLTSNSLECSKPETVERVELSVNDGVNQLVAYPLDSQQEILYHYLQSMGGHEHNNVSIDKLVNDKNRWGVGYQYGGVYLKNAKVGVQVLSDLSEAFAMFFYFSNMMEI